MNIVIAYNTGSKCQILSFKLRRLWINVAQGFHLRYVHLSPSRIQKLQIDDRKPSAPQLDKELPSTLTVKTIILPLYESRYWIRLFAACLIVYGALITVTGVGILVAWVPIWIGVLLLLISKSLRTAYEKDDAQALLLSLSRMKTIFTVLGLSSVAIIIISVYLINYAFEKSLF